VNRLTKAGASRYSAVYMYVY